MNNSQTIVFTLFLILIIPIFIGFYYLIKFIKKQIKNDQSNYLNINNNINYTSD